MKALLILLAALPAAAADSYVLRGGTIHPVSGPEIPNGSVVITAGKIAAVGARVATPGGAKVIDVKGLHVYPGMIDSATQIGLTEIDSVRETDDVNEIGDFNPQLRAIIAVNPASEHIPVTRANGITSVVTLPGGGVLGGQAALIHLAGWTWEEMAVQRSVAMTLQFPVISTGPARFIDANAPRRSFADSKKAHDDQIRQLHDHLEQARRYQQAKAHPAPGFKADLKMEAMLPVLSGQLPLMITAVRERAIREAIEFAGKEKVRIVLAGVREPGQQLAVLKSKDIPVILGRTLALPAAEDDPYDDPFTLPARLQQAGVRFAFGTFTTAFSRNLPFEAANAAAFGLSKENALKAITLAPAQIWGVSDRLGSIEAGKIADLVIADGDLLETRTRIMQVFIDGQPIDLSNKHTRLYERYSGRQ